MPRRGNVLCASGRCPHEGVGLRGIYVFSTYHSLISPASPVIPPSIAYPITLTHCQSFLAASLSSSQWQLTYLHASTPSRRMPPLDLTIASASHGGSWTELYCTPHKVHRHGAASRFRQLGAPSRCLSSDPGILPATTWAFSALHASCVLPASCALHYRRTCRTLRSHPRSSSRRGSAPPAHRTGPRCTSWRQAYAHLPGAFPQDRRQQRCWR